MGLSQAISTAAAGLRTTQSGLSLIAANVANVDTPGYIRKTITQQATAAGDVGFSVRTVGINRELDQFVQRQLRVETSGGAYADLRTQFYQRLQGIYGDPNSASSLETVFGNFTGAMQALATNPADYSVRSAALTSAQVLTQQLNGVSADIQSLRGDAEAGIADSVRNANDALNRLAQINQQVQTSNMDDSALATLLDQRDASLNQLSQLMDIRVVEQSNGEVSVFTGSGLQLVGTKAAHLAFQAQGTVTAQTQWSADPTQRSVGTVMLITPDGGSTDLVANHAIQSGQIAAYLDMRDNVLVQAQAQLDDFAAAMSRALSDKTTAGTAVSLGAQSGYDIDVGGLQAGNSIRLTYTDTTTGTKRTATIMRVDDASVLPLPNTMTTDPNDKVIGIDWSGGLAGVVSQLNAAFGGRVQFSNPSGTTLRILDDGAGNLADVNSVSATATVSTLSSGAPQLPFFLDGAFAYTGASGSGGSQTVGLAGRIAVNGALVADPSKLVAYQPTTANGDPTRPDFIYTQLTAAPLTFSPGTGIGTVSAPYTGPLTSYLRQVMSQQGDAATAAKSLSDGQDMVVNALQQRFDEASGVNIDREMSNLLDLQTSYAANARVLSAIKDIMNMLIGI